MNVIETVEDKHDNCLHFFTQSWQTRHNETNDLRAAAGDQRDEGQVRVVGTAQAASFAAGMETIQY